MPELPEVELVKRQLVKYLIGHKVLSVEVNYRKSLPKGEYDLIGGKIVNIRRFGKALVIDFDNKYSVIIHVKLTGQLIYRGPRLKKPPILSKKVLDGIPGIHTHVVFELDRGGTLYFNDVRKFGWLKIVKTEDVKNVDFIKKLGQEPLSSLTIEDFVKLLASSRRSIKTLLMDQSKISGVGNIYANDALWLAKIHPETSANKINRRKACVLFKAIEKVLREGIKRGGASELSFVTPDGGEGSYQNYALSYGKEGEVCKRCKQSKFKKIKIAGRGTYYCPTCQKRN